MRVGSHWHKFYFDALLTARALSWARRQRVDIVHGHLHEGALVGSIVSKAARVPLVFDFQGSLTREMIDHNFLRTNSPFLPLFDRAERTINHFADHIITSSASATELLVDEFAIAQERVTTVADCVDTSRFRPNWSDSAVAEKAAALRRKLEIPPERDVVCVLGPACRISRDIALTAGRGGDCGCAPPDPLPHHGVPGHHYYQSIAQRMGIAGHTTFPGRIPYADAPSYLTIGDVAVSPKLSETEGNGKLLNYMACDCPRLRLPRRWHRKFWASTVSTRLWAIRHPSQRSCAPLLDEPAHRCRLGQVLRDQAEQERSWSGATAKLLAVYHQAWRRRGSAQTDAAC